VKRDVQFVKAVDTPFAQVRDRMRNGPGSLLGTVVDGSVVATLRAHVGRTEVVRDMVIEIVAFDEPSETTASGAHLLFRGDASRHPDLFPHLEARIDVVPIAPLRTALFFTATYKPPLGLMGGTADALVLHRLAEESLSGLLDDVAARVVVPSS
jgi:hypothetical protein